jgi:hypothetical protein
VARHGGGGEDTPSEPECLRGHDEDEDEDGEEGEETPPPHSLLSEDLPSLGDIFRWQSGISLGACQPKWPYIETKQLTGLPS